MEEKHNASQVIAGNQQLIWRHLQTDGNPLTAFVTIPDWKLSGRTRSIAEPKGNKTKDWAIRSQAPKPVNDKGMEKVQRLKVWGSDELINSNEGLRYSPAVWKQNRISTQNHVGHGWPKYCIQGQKAIC